jgi:16S rRNA (guanine966-N2)-methyltransferase
VRIVAGKWRGRRITAPADYRVRPTADRIREAWLNIMNPWLPESRVLDLFAGSGALGLEALSRGAARAEFVEIEPAGLRAIRENVEALGAGEAAVIHRADAMRFVTRLDPHAFDIAFADPPYGLRLATRIAEAWLEQPFAYTLGIEHRKDETLPGDGERRKYGDTVVTLLRAP